MKRLRGKERKRQSDKKKKGKRQKPRKPLEEYGGCAAAVMLPFWSYKSKLLTPNRQHPRAFFQKAAILFKAINRNKPFNGSAMDSPPTPPYCGSVAAALHLMNAQIRCGSCREKVYGVFYKLRDKERSKESAYVLVGFLARPFVSFVSHIARYAPSSTDKSSSLRNQKSTQPNF